jgi:hypothetical protein
MWMSLSGVLRNHPDLISGFSVPAWLVPRQYHPKNWNRSGIVSAVFNDHDGQQVAYLGGKVGIYKSINGSVLEDPLHDGLPASDYYRKTNHLFLLKSDNKTNLLAATDGGLFICSTIEEKWKQIKLGSERERAMKILQVKDQLVVFTESNAFASKWRRNLRLSNAKECFLQLPNAPLELSIRDT